MVAIWTLFYGWLPAPFQVALLVLVSIVLVIVVFRLIALILDALPFL